jgi:alkyl sulfatase BDS1-like metallo-beta-lactamase superfamily hydrolase
MVLVTLHGAGLLTASVKAFVVWLAALSTTLIVNAKGEPAVVDGVPLSVAPFSMSPGGKAPESSENI